MLAYLLLGASMALVGSYVALSRPLLAVFPVFLLAWLRFGIGALAMPHWLRRAPDEAPLGRRALGLLFLQSLFGNFLFSLCMLTGVSLTGAVSAGVIMAAIPAAVALMSRIFLGERASPRVWMAIACAVAGIALLTLGKSPVGASAGEGGPASPWSGAWLGNLLVFAAVLCEAAYVVIGKKLSATVGAKRVTAIINLWGLALMTPFGLAVALSFDFGGVGSGDWALLLFYGLAASVWSVWLWMTGTRFAPAAQGGVMTVMLPVSATLVGVIWLGESIFGLQWLALGLAIAGVLLVTLAPRHATPA